MNDFEQYRESFLEGFYFSISEDILIDNIPEVDYSNFKSIGYYDGYMHGRKNLFIGRKKIITSLLEDVIHNHYVIALNLHKNYEDKYVWYKDGFVMGVNDVREKYALSEDSFNVIPELDDADIYSIGYYDGYCYYLNKILNDTDELNETSIQDRIEDISKQYYTNSFSSYSIFTNDTNKKIG